jgi:hypothetical protein
MIGQVTYDSVLTFNRELEEVIVVQKQTQSIVEQSGNRLVVDMSAISQMPKFLGVSDPIRYLQSLAGVTTNNETTAGIYVQGCDDYQTLTSINGAPVYYPNHLLGLYSTFIAPHFTTMTVEQAEHRGTMENRVGGMVNAATQHHQPQRFGVEGNIGLICSDATLTIPCGKKSALWLSGRISYINMLYGKWLQIEGLGLGYDFWDTNLTYAIHPTERDELVVSGFFSNDNINIADTSRFGVRVHWNNIVGSAYWNHRLEGGNWRTSISYSGFNNYIAVDALATDVYTQAKWASIDVKNRLSMRLQDDLMLNASIDYTHYFHLPLQFMSNGGLSIMQLPQSSPMQHGDEVSLGIDLGQSVNDWFGYNAGVHGSIFHSNRIFWGCDPRITLRFRPAENHEINLHGGCYTQYFHKAGLTGGGLPTDFFILADSTLAAERAIGLNLRYAASFLNQQWTFQVEGYFKQLYGVVESLGNIVQLINKGFDYQKYLITGAGRNYGMNLMLQRNKGILTGHISYSLGWAKRQLPDLDGSYDYIYAAGHERRHDLNIVLNAHFAKRWTIGGQFVLASGLPYTRAEEAYMLNGSMICRYSTFNGAHLPLYNRLDLSCSCDIIKTKEHELGINLSLYNVYCHKNAQFVVYRDNLRPVYGTSLSIIIPSISIYGKF